MVDFVYKRMKAAEVQGEGLFDQELSNFLSDRGKIKMELSGNKKIITTLAHSTDRRERA